jgi:hypothetical protein
MGVACVAIFEGEAIGGKITTFGCPTSMPKKPVALAKHCLAGG